MGFNIKNNYGPNIEVNAGGKVTLVQDKNGLWTADVEEAQIVENEIKEQVGIDDVDVIPKELQTEEARPLWEKLREAGFIVTDGYALAKGVSNNQAAYIADCMAVKLNIKNKWKVFEQLWGIKNMAQLAGTWRDTGKNPARADEIRDLLK